MIFTSRKVGRSVVGRSVGRSSLFIKLMFKIIKMMTPLRYGRNVARKEYKRQLPACKKVVCASSNVLPRHRASDDDAKPKYAEIYLTHYKGGSKESHTFPRSTETK